MPQGVEGQGSAPSAQVAEYRADGLSALTGLRIPFLADDFSRAYGYPPARLKNMISEATPLRETRAFSAASGLREVRYSRPGLLNSANLGTGPIRGMCEQLGTVLGEFWVATGSQLYREGALVGSIAAGTDLVRFAYSRNQLVFCAAGVAYWTDNGLTPINVVPDLPGPCIDVAFLAGRFVYVIGGQDTFYYSEINDAGNVTGLDFETAESMPDAIVAVSVLNDELVFFGQGSVEFWSATSDINNPFAPNTGRGYQRGCVSRDTVVFVDNAHCWLAPTGIVYRTANAPERISTSSIEDAIRRSTNKGAATAFSVIFDGHELYVLNLPGAGSFAYDVSRSEWAEWTSFGRSVFRGQCAISRLSTDEQLVGDDTTNDIWQMQVGHNLDGNSAPVGAIERKASAFIKIEEGRPRCDSLTLHCVVGVGTPANPGANPLVEMRYSDDQGRTFSNWRAKPLGKVGAYKTRVWWQRLGQMRAPGRLIEVRCTENVDVAFSHLELNAARPNV